MPKTVSAFFDEMLSSASLSFKLYSELSIGAYNCINHHASDEIKNRYLPKIVEGKWSGTMCLTEPVCGTDLGLLKTKAEKQSDGTYKITGQKIFITSGDQDLTENIIHLVIARATDSPAGTKGISLFLVPKFKVNEDGTVGQRNGISTGSIESKMGIKGSATCVLNFDQATGFMIGKKDKGLNAMFTMMNLERIVVGIQGLGISEIAYQNSLAYAKERKQGKTNNTKSTNGADFIIEHADIRRSLLNMKSIIEGERALCFWLSQQTEVSLNHPDEKIRQEASDFVSLMTPVVKSLFTDLGMEITNDAMQIHGGYGYTKDQGIEQLFRDNRITPIYEGTNSVQAADLVFRKLSNKNGSIINKFLDLSLTNEIAVKEREYKLENAKFLPDLSAGYFNQQIEGVKNFSGFEVGLKIPLFFRSQQGKSQAAKKSAEIASINYQQTKLELDAIVQTKLNEYEKQKAALAYYNSTGILLADKLFSSAIKAYKEGEIGYVEYIALMEQSIEIRSGYLNALNLHNQTVNEINYLTGKYN